jgi:hypothetical protein
MSTTQETPQAFCVKCKKKTDVVNGEEVTMKNGRAAMKGHCKDCNTKVFKILGNSKKK